MSDWKTYKLHEITDKIGSGATPKGGKEAYLERGDISLIRSQNVLDFFFSKNGLAFISEEQANELRNVTIEKDDILLNITGDSVARVCKVPNELIPARVNQHVAIIRSAKDSVSSNFLKYYLLEPSFKRYMLGLASSGATRNALTKAMIENFEISLPDLLTQESIASILTSLDNKIELNLQMNQTLETMAQAIFKEWFVNFNFPGFDGELVDGLPKGWYFDKLGKHLTTVLGGTPSTINKSFWENGTIPWINSGKVNEFRITEPTTYITEDAIKSSNTRLLKKGTTVIAITGATLGQVSRLEIDSCANQSVVGILESKTIKSEFIYLWAKLNILEIIKSQTGGAQQHINKNDVNNTDLLITTDVIQNEFEKIVAPLFDKIRLNCFYNQTVIQLRNNLLPNLMAGKIEVKHEQHHRK